MLPASEAMLFAVVVLSAFILLSMSLVLRRRSFDAARDATTRPEVLLVLVVLLATAAVRGG